MKRSFNFSSPNNQAKKPMTMNNNSLEVTTVSTSAVPMTGQNERTTKNPALFLIPVNNPPYFLTGTVERAIKWHRVCPAINCVFEVIATAVSVQESSQAGIMKCLVRDYKGPILQVLYCTDNGPQDAEQFLEGELVKCTGVMVGGNVLAANCIRRASVEDSNALSRYCYLGDNTIGRLVNHTK